MLGFPKSHWNKFNQIFPIKLIHLLGEKWSEGQKDKFLVFLNRDSINSPKDPVLHDWKMYNKYNFKK